MRPHYTNAGYAIIEYEQYNENAGNDYYIVLGADFKTNRFVTWNCTNADDFYWGHYFNSYIDARIDYHKRLVEAYKLRKEME